MTRFFLGTHQPHWLGEARFADASLFVSHRRLREVRRLPRASGPWALDSGGFTELQMHGRWTTTPREYVDAVRRYASEVGNLAWAAPQDWMCEPAVLAGASALGTSPSFRGTGLTVREHQRRTVANFLELRSIAPDLPFIPVLQGWTIGDYWRCEDLYAGAGVDLAAEPVVGVGTMCRRQSTTSAGRILASLASGGVRLHGFGFKVRGLLMSAQFLASADSMAWSYEGRRAPPLPGHDLPGPGRPRGHKNCANCADYALEWRERIVSLLEREQREREHVASEGFERTAALEGGA